MKTNIKMVHIELHFSPEYKGIVTLQKKNGDTQEIDLLLLHQDKTLFYQLPKEQIDLLSRNAALISHFLDQHKTQMHIQKLLKTSSTTRIASLL